MKCFRHDEGKVCPQCGLDRRIAAMTNAFLCPRCKKRDREVIDGETQFYCDACNDRLAEGYREQQEFNHFHSED